MLQGAISSSSHKIFDHHNYVKFRSHAIEFAESGVRVNCVAPGVIFSQTARDNYVFDVFGAAKPGIPAKRLGTPEEV